LGDLALELDLEPAVVQGSLERLQSRGFLGGRGWLVAPRRPIVVIGGAVMDLKVQTRTPAVTGTSNPGHAIWAPGGVGRNIAETLARLGNPVELIAAVGGDPAGVELVERTKAAGVGVDHLVRTAEQSGVYCAVVDDSGELVIGVSDMRATDQVTIRLLMPHRDLIANAEVLVLDGNLSPQVIGWLLDYALAAGVPVLLDTVSVAKAEWIGPVLNPTRPVHTVTPNIDELAGLLGHPVGTSTQEIVAAAAELHARGVSNVWVRRGPSGSLLSTWSDEEGTEVHEFAAPQAEVVDVTGAGDSMSAGYLHAWLAVGDVVEAAHFGQALASLTVESTDTVRADLTPDLVEARVRRDLPTLPQGA
jgi:pseudouridine kinase